MGLRDTLNSKPWIAWTIAGVALAAAVVLYWRGMGSSAPDSLERRSEMVTIRCTETGQEWQMNRGEFERLLMTQPGLLDPAKGIPSKFADNRPTGVLVDKNDWVETVNRINAMKKHLGVAKP
ncbi:MAG: hypothetical protein Kow0022_11640 [Phycisphaerales bacterium]